MTRVPARLKQVLHTEEFTLTSAMLDYAVDLARRIRARGILVYSDAFGNVEATGEIITSNPEVNFIVVARDAKAAAGARCFVDQVIEVPPVRLTRIGQVKLALLLGLSHGIFQRGDTVICLSGIADSGQLDAMFCMHVGEEFEMMAAVDPKNGELNEGLTTDVFNKVLELAISLGHQGREGKPVGTTFVIGDPHELKPFCRQMVLNPFHGHPEESRNIFSSELQETIKEYSSIDGAFVIREDGIVKSAGVYLQPTVPPEDLPRGLGARHHSAAGITATTSASAITISESTGTVTVYQRGRIFIELEAPRRIGAPTKKSDEFFEKDPMT